MATEAFDQDTKQINEAGLGIELAAPAG